MILLVKFSVLIVSTSMSCLIGLKSNKCCMTMKNQGIDFETFIESVGHENEIHSLTIDHIERFFNVRVPDENNIMTVNPFFSGHPILKHAPKLSQDDEIFSLSMKTLDFILSNNYDIDQFYIQGLNHIKNLEFQ